MFECMIARQIVFFLVLFIINEIHIISSINISFLLSALASYGGAQTWLQLLHDEILISIKKQCEPLGGRHGVQYREDRPFLGILITSFTRSQGISMQITLKGHTVKGDCVPNGVYKQLSPHTDRPICLLLQLNDQTVLPNWMNEWYILLVPLQWIQLERSSTKGVLMWQFGLLQLYHYTRLTLL